MKVNPNRSSETPNSSPNPIKQLLNVIAHAVQKISSKIFGRQETPADSPPTLDRAVVKKQTTQKTTLSSIFHKIFSFFYRDTPATPLPQNNIEDAPCSSEQPPKVLLVEESQASLLKTRLTGWIDKYVQNENISEKTKSEAKRLYLAIINFQKANNSTSLDLSSYKELTDLPDCFDLIGNLKRLNLQSFKELQELPPSLIALTKLETLNLSFCESLHVLPKSLATLTNLKIVDISFCKNLGSLNESLPESLATLTNLETLDIRGWYNLKKLPDFLKNIKTLKRIETRLLLTHEANLVLLDIKRNNP